MKHFISFQKRKGLFVSTPEFPCQNPALAHQLNHQLMKYGFMLTRELFDALSILGESELQVIYADLMKGIKEVVGGSNFEPIYKGFPQSVLDAQYTTYMYTHIYQYWISRTWPVEAEKYIQREFKMEPIKYKEVGLLTKAEFDNIFTDLVYSPVSLSTFDKKIVDYFIDEGVKFNFGGIKFKETLAYVGKRILELPSTMSLPTKDATNVLRIWSAYSGGDEGLKTNTRFKNPNAKQRIILLATLNDCYNLEESFKMNREKWLRLLFYINPMTSLNSKLYPNVGNYANLLRNSPKELRTFNSRVEELMGKKSPMVLELLKKNKGMFMRRLDHTVRLFGISAVQAWLQTNPDFTQLVTVFNHFSDRDKQSAGRGAVLAGAGASEVVTYEAQAPLDAELVTLIKSNISAAIGNACSGSVLNGKRVFIDRALYYRPMAVNNRASSLSLTGKANGTVEVADKGAVIRMYCHWSGGSDIDLSGFVIKTDNSVTKVGWNASYALSDCVVYSGDNRGRGENNAEYLDVVVDKLPDGTEWIISEAVIFRGPNTFAEYTKPVRMGWMIRKSPQHNEIFAPDTLVNASVVSSKAQSAYLLALHVPTRSIVYLDLAMSNGSVTNAEDALKMRIYLESLVTFDDGSTEVNWDKINQGHILNLLAEAVVEEKSQADIVFDENTTWEGVAKYL